MDRCISEVPPFVFSRLNKGLKMVDMTYMFVALHFASYYNIILA